MKHTMFWVVLLFPAFLAAQLSPGKLSEAHSHLEGLANCSQCHSQKQRISADRCLTCHTLLKERIDAGEGLHARESHADCRTCHVEHHGREFNIVWWQDGKENFDHRLAGYILEGAHKTLDCRQCHTAENIQNPQRLLEKDKDLDRTFLGLGTDCLSCHTDEHRDQLDKTCTNCHSQQQWKPAVKFSHRTARFQLVGKHQTVDCASCHPTITDNRHEKDTAYSKYVGISFSSCTDCHTDIHNNRFGQNCQSCHTPFGWDDVKTAAFDHSRTQFPLLGEHQSIACESCHTPGQSIKINNFENCSDCHNDYHRGQFTDRAHGGACEECHTENGFSPSTFTIPMHQETDFHLKGSHLAIPCVSCHTTQNAGMRNEIMKFDFNSTECVACHDNPHQTSVDTFLADNGCQHCHTEDGWADMNFDHSETGYELIGRHAETTCLQCHEPVSVAKPTENLVFQELSTRCQNCHDDVHLGQFREDPEDTIEKRTACQRCHAPVDWFAEKFDHNRDSKFKIDGAHQYVSCEQCHPQVTVRGQTVRMYKLPDTDCSYCHDTQEQ